MAASARREELHHAVIVPFPAQGHINPCLQVARQLVQVHGFAVTFVNTTKSLHDRVVRSSQSAATRWNSRINFVLLPDPERTLQQKKVLSSLGHLMEALMTMGPSFEALFSHLLADSPGITCVIRDLNMPWVHNPAKKCDIPVVALATMSAVATHCNFHSQTLTSAGLLPLPHDDHRPSPAEPSRSWLDRALRFPGLPRSAAMAAAMKRRIGDALPGVSRNVTVEELPSSLLIPGPVPPMFETMRAESCELLRDCACVLVNTFFELESVAILAMDENDLILPVGPLVFVESEEAAAEEEPVLGDALCPLWEEDPATLQWLQSQQPHSVLYVSFGSLATLRVAQLIEIAQGLEASDHPFLWVIREDLVEGGPDSEGFSSFMSGFRTATKQRGFIAPWVSQTAVLSHGAVGAFLTHCGWNSTLEGVSAGVPMVAMPVMSEQRLNAFYVTKVWGSGVRLELGEDGGDELVGRDQVERKVRAMMAGEELESVRTRARELREAAKRAVVAGGSSHTAMAQFVERFSAARREPAIGAAHINTKFADG